MPSPIQACLDGIAGRFYDHTELALIVMNLSERIEINPEVCNGRPVVRSTRIAVETILSYLGAGDMIEYVLIAHPRLTREDVLACIEYARRLSAARSTVLMALHA